MLAAASIAVLMSAADHHEPVVINTDAGWCWFQDERAIIVGDRLLASTVAVGREDESRKGDIDLNIVDLSTGEVTIVELHDQLEPDDHDAASLIALEDGRVLAMWSDHRRNEFFWKSVGDPTKPQEWPDYDTVTIENAGITYSNLFDVGDGVMVNFFRGLDNEFDPSYVLSRDGGESWEPGSIIVAAPGRPYAKYVAADDSVHVVFTHAHPRDWDNSLYYTELAHDELRAPVSEPPVTIEEESREVSGAEQIFAGAADAVAWPADVDIDEDGNPVVVFTVQKDGAGLPTGQGGEDIRFHYASKIGGNWRQYEIAYAGHRLYSGEDDYTGLAAIDPDNPNIVYISTSAHPVTGKPLISETDDERHREIFRGVTNDHGATWEWTAITENSEHDNIRPVVPRGDGDGTILLWTRGVMRTYRDYDLELVMLKLDPMD